MLKEKGTEGNRTVVSGFSPDCAFSMLHSTSAMAVFSTKRQPESPSGVVSVSMYENGAFFVLHQVVDVRDSHPPPVPKIPKRSLQQSPFHQDK
jgi:hypothetical protein